MSKKEKKSNVVVEVLKYVVPLVAALGIFLVVKFVFLNADYSMEKIDVTKYQELVKNENQNLIYVTSADCDTCDSITNLLKKVLKGSSIKTFEVNISSMSDDELGNFMNTFEETKEEISTPALILVQNNQIVSKFYGPADEDVFIEFLQNNKLIEK